MDYAGLFPPAALPMDEATRRHAAYRQGPDRWILNRLVVPARRLDELGRSLLGLPVGLRGDDPWRVTVIAGDDLGADIERITMFDDWIEPGLVQIEAVETVVRGTGDVERLRALTPAGLALILELPAGGLTRELAHAIKRASAVAKIRTGGVRPEDIPPAQCILDFLETCAIARLPFKATAGLHHAVRGPASLTYEPASPRATMFGFLNLFTAAIALWHGHGTDEAGRILEEEERAAFRFGGGAVAWRDLRFPADQVADARRRFAVAFGTCSFTEPLEEARALGILGSAAAAGDGRVAARR
jgi:hypothetical protein